MNPLALVEKDEWEEKLHQALTKGIRELDPQSRAVVEARWLAPEKSNLRDLAKEMGLSAERVRQIEKRAFIKVREHLRWIAKEE